MPKLRVLSGDEVLNIFKRFGFELEAQRGSHVKLKRLIGGQKEILTVVLHSELDKGTLRSIFRQASRYISEQELRQFFYTE